jgi:hypothetical protein
MKYLALLLALELPALGQTGPRGRAIKADQVLLDPEVSYEIITTNLLQGAVEDLDSAVATNAAAIAVLEAFDPFSVTNSYTYDDGTTQSVDGLIVRGDLALPDGSITSNYYADGSIYTNHFAQETIDWIETAKETNYDASEYFHGFPKLVLTTNNVVDSRRVNAGTSDTGVLSFADFEDSFDSDRSTATPETRMHRQTGTGFVPSHAYLLDLGESFVGAASIKVGIRDTTVSVFFTPLIGSSNPQEQVGGYTPKEYQGYYVVTDDDTEVIFNFTSLFTGRYLWFGLYGSSDGGNIRYKVYDISVYGVTNAFDNMGGF